MTDERAYASNVEMIKAGFRAFDEGAFDVAAANFHPDIVFYGFDAAARPREFRGVGELFALASETAAGMEVFRNELLHVEAVGAEMVVCRVRGTRQPKGGEKFSFDYVQIFRIENGKITRGVEMLDSAAETYFNALRA